MMTVELGRERARLDIRIECDDGGWAADAITALSGALAQAEKNSDIYAVALQVQGDAVDAEPRALLDYDVLAALYRLAWQIDCFAKPIVAYLRGAVPADISALTINGTHRVAGAHYRFRAREAGPTSLPPLGLGFMLDRLPDALGLYLSLSGRGLGASDAHALGIVSHCLDEAAFAEVLTGLAAADPVDPLLDDRTAPRTAGDLAVLRPCLRQWFAAPTLAQIRAQLENATGPDADHARELSAVLVQSTEGSLVLRHGAVTRSGGRDLRSCLLADYELACWLAAQGGAQPGDAVVLRTWLDGTAGLTDHAPPLALPTRRELEFYKD